jgi:predicted enzyme related to lactoylglutathione lyase
MKTRFAHLNLIAHDWRRLAKFYTTVCVSWSRRNAISRARNWTRARATASRTRLRRAHFRLPGGGDQGPTLEISTYDQLELSSPAAVNRPGFGHIAFEVEDVAAARKQVLSAGGATVGEIVTLTTAT